MPVGVLVGVVVVGEFGDLVDEDVHPAQVDAFGVGFGDVADPEGAQDRRALFGQPQHPAAGGEDFGLGGGDLGVAGSPGFGLDAELEVPEHQRRIGGRDHGLDVGEQHRLARAGGADELLVRVGVEVEHHRLAGLGGAADQPAGGELAGSFGDPDQRVAAQDAQREEPGLVGQLERLDRLGAGGVPQRHTRLGVLPEVLTGAQPHAHGPAMRADPVAEEHPR
jgi:hypothetical protein